MHPNEALFANEAFYLAFNQKDADAMTAVWSQQADLLCLHPGWPLLRGREAVLESWNSILGNPGQPKLQMYGAQGIAVQSAVLVVCYEIVGSAVMVASNLFVPEDGFPRLVHHQSGPCGDPPAPPEALDSLVPSH